MPGPDSVNRRVSGPGTEPGSVPGLARLKWAICKRGLIRLKIYNVSLPIPNTCNYYYSMSGKWYVIVAILVSTISEKSKSSQKCKSTDCQSKNRCSLSHKETMMTWVSTKTTDCVFPYVLSMYICSDLCILNPFQTFFCIQRHNIPYFCRLSISNPGNNMAP